MKISLSIIVILYCCIIGGCASKVQNNTVRFWVNSCFRLLEDEAVIAADKDVEHFFTEYSSLPYISMAFNRVIRNKNNEYIFINLITDKKIQEIKSIIQNDSMLRSTHSRLSVGPVSDYTATITEKKGYWSYYLFYLDKTIEQPFAIIVCSKNKETVQKYFDSHNVIIQRLDCEASE